MLEVWLLVHAATAHAQFTFITNSGTITLTGYSGPGGNVTIPDKINGLPVTGIRMNAFCGCINLTMVVIPNSLTSIGDAAFCSCPNLTEVLLGSSVTNIGSSAFYDCCNLTALTLPNGLTRIGDAAFWGCGLTSVTIPASVTSIGSAPFGYCPSLAAISVNAGNSAYVSAAGVLFDVSQTTLIQYPAARVASSYAIPCSVTRIGDEAFWSSDLTSITIGNTVTNIGRAAFCYCSELTSVAIPDSVSGIADQTFYGCGSLTNVSMGDRLARIDESAFEGCTSLTSLTIPNSVSSVGDYAFYRCSRLTSVHFMGNVPALGWEVFVGGNATVYYLPGTTGWGNWFGGCPTAMWVLPCPLILNRGSSFGVKTNKFSFIISWATNALVVVEACSKLAPSAWSAVQTNALTNGWLYFTDPNWTNYPSRYYRVRSP